MDSENHNIKLCALILTFNEEKILPECLSALSFTDSIFVFDSYSTDSTLEIAKDFGASCIQRKFDNYANQRNAALSSIPEGFEWILMVDADELVTPELQGEILSVMQSGGHHDMYRIRRKDYFQGRWIRYSSGYPTWFPRLFKRGKVRVEREINEEYVVEGTIGSLNNHLLHYPFNKGLDWWYEKHRRYAKMEAEKMCLEVNDSLELGALFHTDPVTRRKAQKRLSYHIPFRPVFVFFAFYVLKLGFLDGKPGLDFCKLRYRYECMIDRQYKLLKKG